MTEQYLPKTCTDGHEFIPRSEITVTEDLVIISGKKKDDTPEEGDVCQKCFQISGKKQGVRDTSLVETFKARASWSEEQTDRNKKVRERRLALAAMGFPDAR